MSERIPVLAVAGPTVSGKTALGIELAKLIMVVHQQIQCNIYVWILQQLNLQSKRCRIPHHLIGILDRNTSFSVADYVDIARNDKAY